MCTKIRLKQEVIHIQPHRGWCWFPKLFQSFASGLDQYELTGMTHASHHKPKLPESTKKTYRLLYSKKQDEKD